MFSRTNFLLCGVTVAFLMASANGFTLPTTRLTTTKTTTKTTSTTTTRTKTAPTTYNSQFRSTSYFALSAKKNKGKNSGGKGFGKAPVVDDVQPMDQAAAALDSNSSGQAPSTGIASPPASFLKSVDGGSNMIPQVDDGKPVEERTASILRGQYGLRTLEEQQEEARKAEAVKEQRQKLEAWQKMADDGQDFDLLNLLPGPVLVGLDLFLKGGLAICTVLFVLAGFGIAVEAWSKSTGSPLPDNIDNFIVNIIEPNFTPGLGVLLTFSISLGAFATAQLASASSSYREDR